MIWFVRQSMGVRIQNKFFYDNGRYEPNNLNSTEITVRHDLANDEMCDIPGTIQESSSKFFPQTDELDDGTDMDHYMHPDTEKNWDQLSPINANPCSKKYHLRHNAKPNCIDIYRD